MNAKKIAPETPPELSPGRTLERPDGFYWQNLVTGELFGPFQTLAEAVDDMEFAAGTESDDADTLRQAEAEIGIADWIDPDTGAPAEEQVPHIDDDDH